MSLYSEGVNYRFWVCLFALFYFRGGYNAARQTLIPLGGYPGHLPLPLCAYARGAVGAYPCGTFPLTADSPCGAAAIS